MLAVTGSFVCCSVVVLFACCCVVLLDNRDLQGCWCWSCGVVACKDNSKVGGCGVSVVWLVLMSVMMIDWFVVFVWISEEGVEN